MFEAKLAALKLNNKDLNSNELRLAKSEALMKKREAELSSLKNREIDNLRKELNRIRNDRGKNNSYELISLLRNQGIVNTNNVPRYSGRYQPRRRDRRRYDDDDDYYYDSVDRRRDRIRRRRRDSPERRRDRRERRDRIRRRREIE